MSKGSKLVKLYLLVFSFGIFNSNIFYAQPYLKDVFKDYYYIGTALNNWHVLGRDVQSMEFAVKHFNSITPENLLKWERVHPKPGEYNFEPADSFVAVGERNNMFMVGHTLVWHSQTPKWVFEDENGNLASKEVLLERLKEHIYTVVGRYKGRIQAWDVLNEVVEDDGSWRKSKWYQIAGTEYIEKAFVYAHEADPDAELYYNDYNEWYPGKRDAIVKIVENLRSKGIRIDGIGMQGHWGLDYPDLKELDEAFKAYSKTGLKVMVTELDMDILPNPMNYTGAEISQSYELRKEFNPYPDYLPDSMHAVQSKRYADFFNIINKYKDSVSRVTFWGIHDGQSWRNHWPIRGRSAYPLLFDKDLQPKPAFNAVINTAEK